MRGMVMSRVLDRVAVMGALMFLFAPARAGDRPQWGQAWSRNMVSEERGLVESFDPASGGNVKWRAALGNQSFATPVVAGGKVLIGTNNDVPRDPKHRVDAGVLMCFNEADGSLAWQLVSPKLEGDRFYDWPHTGWQSPASVEGDRVYAVSNRGEVMCLDLKGMANGNDGPYVDEGKHTTPKGLGEEAVNSTDGDIVWLFDMVKGVGIWPHDAAHSSVMARCGLRRWWRMRRFTSGRARGFLDHGGWAGEARVVRGGSRLADRGDGDGGEWGGLCRDDE
jgi:outer membrane protein assembly factor BamB